MFQTGHFQLRDDVDNEIRGVSYLIGSKIVGALTILDDILPSEEATHLEVFSVPPPKSPLITFSLPLDCRKRS